MAESYQLKVETRGGIHDLGRVVGMLALFDLTPTTLTASGGSGGLCIDVRVAGDPRTCALCLSRLQAVVAFVGAEMTPVCADATRGD